MRVRMSGESTLTPDRLTGTLRAAVLHRAPWRDCSKLHTFDVISRMRYRDRSRGNLAQSCLLKASLTAAGGFSERSGPGLWTIQLQALHPHAAKLLFSNQISSLDMLELLARP